MESRIDRSARRAFLLLEMMLGVAIFSIGVLVLARCLDHCLDAEAYRSRDQLARRALEARLAEIRGNAVSILETPRSDELEGRYRGITLHQRSTPLDLTNEDGDQLTGLYRVDLEAVWTGPDGETSRELHFYALSDETE